MAPSAFPNTRMNTTTLVTPSRLATWGLGLLLALAYTYASADVIAGTGIPSATTLGQRTATQLVGEPGGIGHALIVPYYSTQSGNVSVFSITNTDFANGKAVKVRVRGASNGDSLLSLTVLLGPGDVWNATLRQGANGIAELVTYDSTCAMPRVAEGVVQPLSTSRLNYPAWTDADKANQTREGYAEILTMADIPKTLPTSALFEAIRRNRVPVVPCGESPSEAAVIMDAVGNANLTTEASAAAMGLAAPTSGIAGKWLIINAPETTTFAGSMYALRAVDDNGADARANFVLFPQTAVPYSGTIDGVTADPLLRTVSYELKTLDGIGSHPKAGPAITAAMRDLPDFSTPYVVEPTPDAALVQAGRLTATMLVDSITNEYATEPTLMAKTDWVVSAPALRYSAVRNSGSTLSGRLFSLVPPTGQQYFSIANVTAVGSAICLGWATSYQDREGQVRNRDLTGGLYTQTCGTVGVLSFGDRGNSAISGSITRTNPYFLPFTNGWAVMVPGQVAAPMPVIGNAFIRFHNPSASPGVSGNYGITFEHWLPR